MPLERPVGAFSVLLDSRRSGIIGAAAAAIATEPRVRASISGESDENASRVMRSAAQNSPADRAGNSSFFTDIPGFNAIAPTSEIRQAETAADKI